jgi:hypothetical protein
MEPFGRCHDALKVEAGRDGDEIIKRLAPTQSWKT